jgi:hypothetical protein
MNEEQRYLQLVGTFPHCDALVLHPRGTCQYCDLPENEPLHQYRTDNNINHTGEHDPQKKQCPAEARRPKDLIDRWGGNVARKP